MKSTLNRPHHDAGQQGDVSDIGVWQSLSAAGAPLHWCHIPENFSHAIMLAASANNRWSGAGRGNVGY